MKNELSNWEIVTWAVYLIGGDQGYVDTEDVAMKANELAPGRFTWVKYIDQINIEKVRTSLSDAKKEKYGKLLVGKHIEGWMLSQYGLQYCTSNLGAFEKADISREALYRKERTWRKREKTRLMGTSAYEKIVDINESDSVTKQEAESFFRLDDYVTGIARKKKIERYLTAFADEPELSKAVSILSEMVKENG